VGTATYAVHRNHLPHYNFIVVALCRLCWLHLRKTTRAQDSRQRSRVVQAFSFQYPLGRVCCTLQFSRSRLSALTIMSVRFRNCSASFLWLVTTSFARNLLGTTRPYARDLLCQHTKVPSPPQFLSSGEHRKEISAGLKPFPLDSTLYKAATCSHPPGYLITKPRSSTTISAENPVSPS
jgi:hypothetical protein